MITAARRASPRPLAIVDLLASRGSTVSSAASRRDFVPRSATHAMERLDALAATHRTVALAVRHDDPELGRPRAGPHSRARGPGGGGRARARPRRDVPRRGSGALLRNGGDRHAGRRGPGSAPLRRRAHGAGRGLARASSGPDEARPRLGPAAPSASPTPACSKRLEGAGYEVDYVAGAAWGRWSPLHALGLTAAQIAATLEERCAPSPSSMPIFRKAPPAAGKSSRGSSARRRPIARSWT